jgi:CO/xanthine dehydrogenase Mo-binding subunit
MSILGTRVVRTEDPRLVTAGGSYTDDLRLPELPRGGPGEHGRHPVRAAGVERALADGAPPAAAAAHAAEGTSPADDIDANPAYRKHLARVLVERALVEAQAV